MLRRKKKTEKPATPDSAPAGAEGAAPAGRTPADQPPPAAAPDQVAAQPPSTGAAAPTEPAPAGSSPAAPAASPDPASAPVGPTSPARVAPSTPAGAPETTPEPATPAGASSTGSPAAPGVLVGGIDVGGTKIAAAIVTPDHKVIAYRKRPTPSRGGPPDVLRAMAETIREAAADAGMETEQLRAVGVGAPGKADTATGVLSGAGNLPDWDGNFEMGPTLENEIGTPVRIGNDVQVGTEAEYRLGAGAGYNSMLGVFWGTGVGGGIILDGKLWKGRGRAGEIGHTMVRRGGARGLNGLNGTVEAYAGRKAMEKQARIEVKKGRKTDLFKLMKKHDKPNLTSAIWAKALEKDDELATNLLNRAVKSLAAGIASAVNLLDVDAVVIGGGLGVRFGDTLVPKIIQRTNRYLLNPENPPVIKVAALGDDGGVLGAALLIESLTGRAAPDKPTG